HGGHEADAAGAPLLDELGHGLHVIDRLRAGLFAGPGHHKGLFTFLVLTADDQRPRLPCFQLVLLDHDLLLALLGPPEVDEVLLFDHLDRRPFNLPRDDLLHRAELRARFRTITGDGPLLDGEGQEETRLEAGLPGPPTRHYGQAGRDGYTG